MVIRWYEYKKSIRYFPGEWSRITYGAWREVQQIFKLPIDLSILSSISYIKDFLPLKLDIGFKNWTHNLNFVHQLFRNNNLKSFDQLRAEFSLSKTELYRYLQLRSFIFDHPNRNRLKEPSPLEQYLAKIQEGIHTQKPITNLYRILTSMTKDNTCYVKEKWNTELKQEIMSIVGQLLEINFYDCEQSTRSWSGKKPSDSYSWDEPDITFNRKRMYILQIILIAAKKAITLRWLKQDPPTNAEWVAILDTQTHTPLWTHDPVAWQVAKCGQHKSKMCITHSRSLITSISNC